MKLKNVLLPALLIYAGTLLSQTYNSNPTISDKVIYLDFDGQTVTGTLWNSGNTINAQPSTVSAAAKKEIWQRVSEDYRPFNVNVTNDSTRFNNAQPTSRIRVILTPTSAWYTAPAGGVAYLSSFTWGGYPGTPCWTLENQLGYSAKNMAEAASHEAGHSFSLQHQSTYSSATCSKTAEYNPGVGSGVTSWAPIMGVGYSKNVTLWHNGTNATGCTTYQYDHGNGSPGITGSPFLSFLPDDVGDNLSSGKILNLTTLNLSDSGLITTPTDVDLYRFTICNNRYVSLNVKPWALDTTPGSYLGANLDVKIKLYSGATNTIIIADSTTSRLNARLGANLTPGSYYFTIDGDASAYQSGYGSIGKYYLSVKATNPPVLSGTIFTPTNLCSGQTIPLTYTSIGTPTSWQWSISGPSSGTYAVANPTFNFSPAGIYTINLLASNTSYTGCPSTRTIDVGALPVLSIAGANSYLCPQQTATLIGTGASSYTWMPGNYTGYFLLVTPTVNTTYTLHGNNGSCNNTAISTLSINPNFTVNLTTSTSNLCWGSSATITASGASSYTFNPGNMTSNPAIVTPTYNTNYTVTASSNGCLKTRSSIIYVTPPFDITVTASDSFPCAFEPITLTNTGAYTYTVNPGGLTGNQVVVTPSTITDYTVTGEGNQQCLTDTVISIFTSNCNYLGLSKFNLGNNFKIYPNPSSTYFVIESEADAFNLEVFNALGSIVYNSESKTGAKVNVESWSKGIYFVRVTSGTGPAQLQKIIVK